MPCPRECVSVAEIAEDLGVKVRTVYKYAREDGLPLRKRIGYQRGSFATRKEYAQWKRDHFSIAAQ